MATENALYTILVEKIKQDTLVLPTLPEVALKVRTAADDPDINLNQMSDIIAQDPALSLGMLKVANSALLGRSVKVETVSQAVTRIGLRQIKSIATAMAIEQVFVSQNEIVAMYMKKSWNKTIDIASVAISLMSTYLKDHKHTSLSLDTITLAALIHNIGVLPILTEAESHPDVFANPTFLQQAIIKLSGRIGGSITRAWGFSEELTLLAESWSDLTVLPEEVHYLDFIRAGAIYHNVFKNESTKEALLSNYVKKGVLSDIDYMESEEFKDMCADVKAMFT
ncbi:HDOD domain-containing protein [Litorilituus sediminis]|uniref:HDOD domain-containing protein n=1 Tax=Litorilituus sediminis TaxID=718192 RepID=A0A4P6P1R0_9GAMM|nr:HDOD domain-containing protein [Litorilituus sediminis]QBG35266.1 HDOD domain-containing protein [Litorilituus sediminis]